jgi:type IV pilus assembly protein PilB
VTEVVPPENIDTGAEVEAEGALDPIVEDAPVVKLVNSLLAQAVSDRASDIHIDPSEGDTRVRYRIDGVLHDVMRVPKAVHGGLVSRLKIMADINIAERRLPQHGRTSLTVAGKQVDLRVATLPVIHGERVVIRILDRRAALYRLDELGFLDQPYQRYERSFRKPSGAILVTGPPTSGRSTTLYATLNVINSPDRSIATIEDPVEQRLDGVNQMQVNPKAGLTFATALSSTLRADPDTVLIGELRDRETALLGIEAALTGHLVLSALSTNDAASAITHLIDMGIEPYVVAAALECVVGQRLVRKLCEWCREPYEAPESELVQAGMTGFVGQLFRPVGCPRCGNTGYRGRLGLFEVMPVTAEIGRLATERRSAEDIKRVAEEQGMITLRQDASEKVRKGLTSLEELFRAVP